MKKDDFKTLVIGGGPAGMMAAATAGQAQGGRVVLVEKNKELGVKLLLTGHGRCNLTNTEINTGNLVEKYGKNGKFLLAALRRFGPEEVMAFFAERGVKLKVEEKGKVFPASDRSLDVLNALKKHLAENQVEVMTGAAVKQVVGKDKRIDKVVLADGRELRAEKYIICTGGKSWPQTGSTGDAYAWLRALDHTIVEPAPALAPIVCEDKFVKSLEGVSLREVEIKVFQNNKKHAVFIGLPAQAGDAIFTSDGLSGPAVFGVCKEIGGLLKTGKVELRLDLLPAVSAGELDTRLAALFRLNGNKAIKNVLNLVPGRLAAVILDLAKLDSAKKANSITRVERQTLARLIKEFPLNVKCVCGFDKSMVTSGGVSLREVDPRTMKSKIIDNLYFAGEILDLDGPTGGYNLQVCWSTGRAAGAKPPHTTHSV